MSAINEMQKYVSCMFLALCIVLQIAPGAGSGLHAEGNSPVIRLQRPSEPTEKFDNSEDMTAENPQTTKRIIELNEYRKFTNFALIDFTDSLARIFIETVGNPEGKMTQAQFSSLCESGKFPISISADQYFSSHDRDNDGQLAISEYIPARHELISFTDYRKITDAFIRGEDYPNGEKPSANTVEAPGLSVPPDKQRLFLTSEEIDARVKKFAASIGGQTRSGENGKLEILDNEGNRIEPPSTLVPPKLAEAAILLEKFAGRIGGKIIAEPGKLPIISGPDGKSIPPLYWPRHLRPPYLKD